MAKISECGRLSRPALWSTFGCTLLITIYNKNSTSKQEKGEIMEIEDILQEFPSKRSFKGEFIGC